MNDIFEEREIGELKSLLRKRLSEYDIENAGFEAEQILLASGIPKNVVLWEPRECVSEEQLQKALKMLEKRCSGYPLQYLLGEWSFYALDFKVGEGVLIPRQDTETLTELVDDFLRKRSSNKRRVLDLCAGSGCIGISLARFCGAEAVCVEKSKESFRYLEENIKHNGVSGHVKAVNADIFEVSLDELGKFDAIVSNPPYLTASEMDSLQQEVTFEPKEALYGGDDGLMFYRGIPKRYLNLLADGGLLAVEIGYEQAASVGEIFINYGLEPQFKKDLCGINRVIYTIK